MRVIVWFWEEFMLKMSEVRLMVSGEWREVSGKWRVASG